MKRIQFLDRRSGDIIHEQPPGEAYLRFLYHNPLGALPLSAIVQRKWLSQRYGRMMDQASSRDKIQPFVDTYSIDMTEAQRQVSDFTSFNDFFYRKLKPTARPIGSGIVSPADGKLLAFEHYSDVGRLFVKGSEFTLERFLADKGLAEQFSDASMFIIRLAPNDYHRYHFPYAGQPAARRAIDGYYLSVSPYALAKMFVRVFCENKRSLTRLHTADRGDILLLPVGATMVGGINDTYSPGQKIKKGDEMGYFSFGGSTIVMLIDSQHCQIDADLLHHSRQGIEVAVRMGEKIAS